MRREFKLAVAIGISLCAGVIGSLFTSASLDLWYVNLIKPQFNPPAWVFGPVWTVLFVLMGVASFIVWEKVRSNRHAHYALYIFGFQLVLNILWSGFFFGLRSPGIAFIDIVSLWFAILITIVSFVKISKLAGFLLIPYIFWVSFAAYLNYSIYILNI